MWFGMTGKSPACDAMRRFRAYDDGGVSVVRGRRRFVLALAEGVGFVRGRRFVLALAAALMLRTGAGVCNRRDDRLSAY